MSLRSLQSKNRYTLLLLVDENYFNVCCSRVMKALSLPRIEFPFSLFHVVGECECAKSFENYHREKKVWLMNVFVAVKKRNRRIINYVCLWHSRVPIGFNKFSPLRVCHRVEYHNWQKISKLCRHIGSYLINIVNDGKREKENRGLMLL